MILCETSVAANMFWTTGLLLVALTFGQVPAELAKPVYIEDAIAKAPAAADDSNSRIVSGWDAYPGQLPYQAALRMVGPTGEVSACGGSVVHRSWVISAAHCTASRITVVVRAGVTHMTTPVYIYETTEWWNYPTYDDNNPLLVQPNDISIVKLQIPVTYSRLLQPVRIQPSAQAFANYDSELVVASGWGRTWTNGVQPETLQWVYLRAISNQACGQTFGTALINDAAICARWYNVTSQSTCQGDSGGPLVHHGSDGVPVLVGIASFVAGGSWGCHSGLPAGFIRPGPFLGWLEQVTGVDFENFEEEEATEAPSTTAVPTTTTTTTTTTTAAPTTTTTTTAAPSTVTEPITTTAATSATTEDVCITTTNPAPTSPTPEPEGESEEDESDSGESEEDPEISELLKKLIVSVKVKVKVNNEVKKKIKVKSEDAL